MKKRGRYCKGTFIPSFVTMSILFIGRGLKKLGRNFERQVNEIRASSKEVKKDMKSHIKAFTPFLKEQISTMKSLIRKQKEDSKVF